MGQFLKDGAKRGTRRASEQMALKAEQQAEVMAMVKAKAKVKSKAKGKANAHAAAEKPTPVLRCRGEWRPTLAAGGGHSMVCSLGALATFGWGCHGQTGHGAATNNAELPRPVVDLLGRRVHVVMVAAGLTHSAVVDDGGRLFTFGGGHSGQLGLGDLNGRRLPAMAGRFVEVRKQGQHVSMRVPW